MTDIIFSVPLGNENVTTQKYDFRRAGIRVPTCTEKPVKWDGIFQSLIGSRISLQVLPRILYMTYLGF